MTFGHPVRPSRTRAPAHDSVEWRSVGPLRYSASCFFGLRNRVALVDDADVAAKNGVLARICLIQHRDIVLCSVCRDTKLEARYNVRVGLESDLLITRYAHVECRRC